MVNEKKCNKTRHKHGGYRAFLRARRKTRKVIVEK